MMEAGFKRRGNSLNYFRTIGTTKQKLDMAYYFRPSYYTGALLHIYPLIDDMAGKIRIFLQQCIIPLFDDLKTIDDYIDRYEQNDVRAYFISTKGYFMLPVPM